MKVPRRTLTSPDPPDRKWFEGPNPPTAVRTWGPAVGNEEHLLDVRQTLYRCGANPACDVCVNDPYVSGEHAILERRGGADRDERMRVIALDPKNGIRLNGTRYSSFDVGVGQVFELAHQVTALLMNEAMRAGRVRFVETLGHGAPDLTPDQLLIEALGSQNMVVVGEKGCGHETLARAVHSVSIRRTLPPELIRSIPTDPAEQDAILARATRSTLIVDIKPEDTNAHRVFLETLMSAHHQIRVIALAPTIAQATRVLGVEIVGRMRPILLRPLRTRIGELPQIFDQLLAARASTLRMEHLSAPHQHALRSYPWPRNLEELADVALRVAALAPSPAQILPVQQAAANLGMGESWFYGLLNRVGLSQFWKTLLTPPTPPSAPRPSRARRGR